MSRVAAPRTKEELISEAAELLETAQAKCSHAEQNVKKAMKKLRDLDRALKAAPTA